MTRHEPRLSVGLALDSVKDSQATVRRLTDELEYARKERNRIIREALSFVTIAQLMRVTGLSRDMLYRIKNSPED